MIATNIQQSKHLLELGLDPKTADLMWVRYAAGRYRLEVLHRELFERIMETDIAAWSLSALLKVMAAHLKGWPAEEDERLTLAKYHRMDADGPCYVINYSNPLNGSFAFPKLAHNPVTAAYEMVCWLLEQGLIKKGGQDD